MKINLVVPKPKEPFTPYGPPLGLCYIAAYLKSKGHQDIRGIDLNINTQEDLLSFLTGSDIVGIYCSTKSLSASLKLAEIAKKNGAMVVMGGPHPSLCPDEIMANKNVDFLVRGEGEITFYELVDALKNDSGLEEIRGLTYRKGDAVIHNPVREVINNLDDLPFPDRTVFDLAKYTSPSLTIAASRGCPYGCANCQPALTTLCGRFRYRSVDNVLKEIKEELIEKYNCRTISLIDNDPTANRRWITEFCNKIIEQNLKFFWDSQGGVNNLDKELLLLMKRAGCWKVSMGVETGSKRVLKELLHKRISLEHAKKVIDWANEVKVGIHTWFIIGIPGETKEEMAQTIDLASSINVLSIGFSVGTPWPGTEFYSVCKKNGWLLTNDWTEYNEKKYCRLKTNDFDPSNIEETRKKIFNTFRKKGWEVNENDFFLSNPYYDKSKIGFVKNTIKRIAFPIFGKDRIIGVYNSIRLRLY